MGIKFQPWGGLLVVLATGVVFPSVASAQTETPKVYTTNETFERAFFSNDPNFYENSTSFKRQLDWILGTGAGFGSSFPENEITRDGALLHTLYTDVLRQQASNDPYIRTPDLPNPYNSSLLTSPSYNINQLKVGTEYRFESISPK